MDIFERTTVRNEFRDRFKALLGAFLARALQENRLKRWTFYMFFFIFCCDEMISKTDLSEGSKSSSPRNVLDMTYPRSTAQSTTIKYFSRIGRIFLGGPVPRSWRWPRCKTQGRSKSHCIELQDSFVQKPGERGLIFVIQLKNFLMWNLPRGRIGRWTYCLHKCLLIACQRKIVPFPFRNFLRKLQMVSCGEVVLKWSGLQGKLGLCNKRRGTGRPDWKLSYVIHKFIILL